jgi:hypothetical protein
MHRFQTLLNDLATLLETDGQKIAVRTEILQIQMERFGKGDLSTLHTIASLIRNYSNEEDYGSVLLHHEGITEHLEEFKRQSPQEYAEVEEAAQNARQAVSRMPADQYPVLRQRSRGLPASAIPSHTSSSLPIRGLRPFGESAFGTYPHNIFYPFNQQGRGRR